MTYPRTFAGWKPAAGGNRKIKGNRALTMSKLATREMDERGTASASLADPLLHILSAMSFALDWRHNAI